jgi:hypothetical protein
VAAISANQRQRLLRSEAGFLEQEGTKGSNPGEACGTWFGEASPAGVDLSRQSMPARRATSLLPHPGRPAIIRIMSFSLRFIR